MNYLPYLKLNHSSSKRQLKILIDTGANKNIIAPGILENTTTIPNTTITNVRGKNNVSEKGTLDIFKGSFKPLPFYVLKFHQFFDGLIGSESLAKLNAKINFETSTITLLEKQFAYAKYFPTKQLYNHSVTLETTNNGDWFVPSFQKLSKNILIQPGLYRARNNKTTINIISSNKNPTNLPKLKLSLNNFETISPIPLKHTQTLSEEEIEDIIRTEHLSTLEKDKLIKLLHEHQAVVLKQGEKLSSTSATTHKILTNNEMPIYTKNYRYPHHFKQDVHDQIQEMLDNGIIRQSKSPYSSPIWVVPKKLDASGKKKVRVVIDYRKLNEQTIDDRYPMPQIEEILDSLGKSEYFSTLDLKSGFHQIPMDPKHIEKTAFSTDKGHFEFTRMPFGLKNAPATFQRAMNNILADYIGTKCYVYLDDIIIIGFNLENHIENLRLVLKRLCEFNLKIQLDKCEFLKKQTEFLGHIISSEGVKPNPEKIEKIIQWPLPKTQKEIKQFLGLVGYYRRFIKDFSKITRPMSKFLKKDAEVNPQDPSYTNSFNTLKSILSTDQILAYPQFDHPFILTTDASGFALGAVLSQMQDNTEKPIAFASRTLSDTESRYATNEKEALAIIWAVNKFKPYLYGQKFTLITDHKPLTFIKTSDKNSKILRWRLDLENYDYEIKYKEGKSNVVADALSRMPIETNINETNNNRSSIIPGNEDAEDGTTSTTNNPPETLPEPSDSETIHSADDSQNYYIHSSERPLNYYRNQLVFRIAQTQTIIHETPFQKFHRTTISQNSYNKEQITQFLKQFHNNRQTALMAPENLIQTIQESYKEHFGQKGHFVFTDRMVEDVQDENRQDQIILREHDRAHRGITEVEAQIRRSYFFPNMCTKIRKYINACETCNCHKYERKPYNIKISPRPITSKPLDTVHMDIFIIDKHSFLSIIDSFSKHLQMMFLRSKNLIDVQKALGKYMSTFGVPTKIITDHETTFQSIQMKDFLSQLGSQISYAASSESNGQIERVHSTVIEIFNTNKQKFKTMGTKSIIKLSVALYNNTIHSSTQYTPNEIIFNHNNIVNPEQISKEAQEIFAKAKTNMEKAQKRMSQQNIKKQDPPFINEGQEVFIIPNIRTKKQPRANKTNANTIQSRTFKNNHGTKRHKNKIKRLKKT
uniref:RNA-directed DNA polymerase n=1 Tax=Pitica errantivirus TaxID=3078414 RepID=A0AB38Z1R9_9VIRU